jgi:hypothetical protein
VRLLWNINESWNLIDWEWIIQTLTFNDNCTFQTAAETYVVEGKLYRTRHVWRRTNIDVTLPSYRLLWCWWMDYFIVACSVTGSNTTCLIVIYKIRLEIVILIITHYEVSLTFILLMWRFRRAPNSIPLHSYIQQDTTLYNLFVSENCNTCFGW